MTPTRSDMKMRRKKSKDADAEKPGMPPDNGLNISIAEPIDRAAHDGKQPSYPLNKP